MTEPLPNPIRVLVKGASTVNWIATMGGPRTDFAFPRALEAELLASGRPARVEAISVPSEQAKRTLRRWEDEFLGSSPDVVVLVYGHYETIHLFLPRWLERHANSLKARPGRVRDLYRQRVLRPIWMALARLQSRVDARLDPNLRRSRPVRVAADLERLITQVQQLGSPLVFVFELLPPASRFRSWFPGMAARIAAMNEAIEGMVAAIDKPNVRYFRVSEVVKKYADGNLDIATPDGFHYSAHLHRMIGTELAREVAKWADSQPHLRLG